MIVPIAELPGESSFAVAGERIVYPITHGRTVVLRDDRGAVLGRVRVPAGNEPEGRVDASAERVALSVTTEDDRYTVRYTGVFADTPLAPLIALHDQVATRDIAFAQEVDGPRVYTVHVRPSFRGGFRWTVHEAGAPETAVPIPRSAFAADFAGDRVAYEKGRRVHVADRRTGAVSRSFRIHDSEDPFALRADGTLAYLRGQSLYVVAPDGTRRRVGEVPGGLSGQGIAWAGERLVVNRGRFVAVLADDGRFRRLGPRTQAIQRLRADGDTVAWTTNGCLVRARVDAGPADAIGPGPCRRTEADLGRVELRPHRVYLPCVAGPGGVCRVAVGHRSYRIPAGRARWLRRRDRRVRVRLVDPGGRRYRVFFSHGTAS